MDSRVKCIACERLDRHALHPHTAVARWSQASIKLESGRILIIDDNDIEQLRAATFFSDLGATVEIAPSALAGLSVLEASHDVRLVLMDCDMPEVSGLEAARRWRRTERGRHTAIPIVGLSQWAAYDYERCLAAGMNDCMPKPLHRDAIEQCIVRWLGQSQPQVGRLARTESYEA